MKEKVKQLLPIIILVLSILVLLPIFLSAISNNGESIMTGITAVFGGGWYAITGVVSVVVNFNVSNLIAFFLLFVVTLVITFIGKEDQKTTQKNMILSIILIAVFVVSTVLFLILLQNTQAVINTWLESDIDYAGSALGIGPILSVIFAIFGALPSILLLNYSLKRNECYFVKRKKRIALLLGD